MRIQNNRDSAWMAITKSDWQLGTYDPSTKELHGYIKDLHWYKASKISIDTEGGLPTYLINPCGDQQLLIESFFLVQKIN